MQDPLARPVDDPLAQPSHGNPADAVHGRELLRDPYWALRAQHELGQAPSWPVPYGYAVQRRAK